MPQTPAPNHHVRHWAVNMPHAGMLGTPDAAKAKGGRHPEGERERLTHSPGHTPRLWYPSNERSRGTKSRCERILFPGRAAPHSGGHISLRGRGQGPDSQLCRTPWGQDTGNNSKITGKQELCLLIFPKKSGLNYTKFPFFRSDSVTQKAGRRYEIIGDKQ